MPAVNPPHSHEVPHAGRLWRQIGLASLIMMSSIFLSRIMGMVRDMVIAAVAGSGADVDAYRVAFVLPEILNHILASGFLSVTFIPIFTRYLAEDREKVGWRVFSIIMTTFGLVMVLLIAIAMIWTPQLLEVLAPGRSDPQFQELAARMTRIILPAQLFFFIGGLLTAVQFARERFLVPALAPLIYNTGIILGGILLGPRLGMEGFAWGVLGGALLGNCVVQYLGARRVGLRYRPVLDLLHPDLARYVLLTVPLMLGLTMTFSMEIFSKLFGSFLPAGSIARIDYAVRIMMALVAFFGQGVGVAVYPFMARFAAGGQPEEMNRLLNQALRYIALAIPFAALVIVLQHEIVFLIYQRGMFKAGDTTATAQVLGFLMLGAVGFAGQTIVNRGFYARQNTILPTVYGSLAVMVSLPVYYLGMRYLGARGIGLAIGFSAVAQVFLIYVIWNRRSGNPDSRKVYGFYLKLASLALPLGGALFGFKHFALTHLDYTTFAGNLLCVMITGGLALLLIAGMARVFHIEEITGLVDLIRKRRRMSPP